MTTWDRFFRLITNPWTLLCYALCVFLAYQYADLPLAIYVHQFNLRTHAPILTVVTALGKWKVYVLLFILSGLFFRYIKTNNELEQKSWFLLACVLIPNLIGFVVKIIVSRARPELFFTENLFGFYWFKLTDLFWSFPSGHSITVGALAVGLSLLISRCLYLFLSLAFLIALTRVVLYFHYLSDVMTGFYLGVLAVGLLNQCWYAKRKCLTS